MFNPTYLKPGTYFKISDVPAPLVTSGDFIPVIVGLGRKELDIFDTLYRGVTPDGTDVISESDVVVSIINIVDVNEISYTQGIDYTLQRVTAANVDTYSVNWNVPQSITGTVTESFLIDPTNDSLKISIDGTAYTISLTNGAAKLAADVAGDINTAVGSSVAGDDGSGKVKITANSIIITGGTSLSLLGFINGQKVESIEPAAGTAYTIYYKRTKRSTEYVQSIFTRLEDVYADQGANVIPTSIVSQDDCSGLSVSAVVDSLALSTFADTGANFTDVEPGMYIKITSGPGTGQIRIICEVTNTTTLIVNNFSENPNTISQYEITDVGEYQTSWGCYFANLGGAQRFITSQVADDVVDDNNWRKAIDNTEEDISGNQGWCVVPMMGVDADESIVSYIKSYLAKVNSTSGNKERKAIFGIKSSGMTATNIISLLTAVDYERVGVITSPYITQNSQNFGSEYLAAYIAGLDCNPDYDSGEPITGKVINLDYIDDPWITYEKRLFGQNGGIVVEKQLADYKIIHYLSTDVTDIIKSEFKVIKQKDSLKKSLRQILNAAMIGTRALTIAIPRAESICRMVLDNKTRFTEIDTYDNLKVEFDTSDPRQLNVSFRFKPTFDIDWILVTFGAHI